MASDEKRDESIRINHAILAFEDQGFERIAGLLNVVRLVRALGSSGVEDIFIYGGDHSEDIQDALRKNGCSENVEVSNLVYDEVSFGEKEEVGVYYIGLFTNVVTDPVFLKTLIEKWQKGEIARRFQIRADSRIRSQDRATQGVGLDRRPNPEVVFESAPRNILWIDKVGGESPGQLEVISNDDISGTFVVLGQGNRLPAQKRGETVEEGEKLNGSLVRDKKRAKKELLQACRKPMNIDGMVCRLLGRPISARISWVLLEFPIKPNHVTAASLVLGLAGALVVALGGYLPMVIGAGLVFFSWVLDNCDGEIARVKYTGSRFGAWFDIYADFITNIAFIGGMAFGLYRSGEGVLMLVLGGYVIFAQSFYNGVVFRYIHRLGVPDEFLFAWWFDNPKDDASVKKSDENTEEYSGREGEASFLSKSFSYIKYLGRRDFFIFAYFIAALLSILDWALWATAIGSTYSLVLTVAHLFATKGMTKN